MPKTLNSNIPPALEKMAMKALARKVEERYQHAREMGNELWHFLSGLQERFERQNLAEYMQTLFAQPYADETQYLEECLAEPSPS